MDLSELDKEVDFIHSEYHPEEGDDFFSVADLIATTSQFDIDTLIKAYKVKYGNPFKRK